MRVVLEIVGGSFDGRTTVLRAPAALSVGRTEMADYSVPDDPLMSGVHFQLDVQPTGVRLRDLQSSNGTMVNGERITEATLDDGATIVAGQTVFKLRLQGAPAKPPMGKDNRVPEQEPIADSDSSAIVKPDETASMTGDQAGIRDTVAASSDRDAPEPPKTTAHDNMQEETTAQPGGKLRLDRVLLEVRSPTSADRKVWLRPGQELTFGSSQQADVMLGHDTMVSPVHFSVKCEIGGCYLRDLGSPHGTLVNDAKVKSAEFATGDRIAVGNTNLVVRLEHRGMAAPASDAIAELAAAGTAPAPTASSVDLAQFTAIIPADASRPFRAAFGDEDPGVRRQALEAAAWSGAAWLLDYCRQVGRQPSPAMLDVLRMLAILGEPSDLELILRIGRESHLGPPRLAVLGAYGHPGVVAYLLSQIRSDDAPAAFAAGQAFTKITGADIESEQRVELPPEDGSEPDEFESEFLEEVKLPDPKLAELHWDKVKEQFKKGTRRCRGFDLSQTAGSELLSQLDMESRWEACLRGKYHGTWNGSLRDLLAYPLAVRGCGKGDSHQIWRP